MYRWNIFTRKFDLTGVGGTIIPELPETISAWNFGLAYSLGVTTIQGADGNPLSSTNPAVFTVPSNVTDGTLIKTEITSNITFDDAVGASSVFVDSLFGFLTGDDTVTGGGSPIPFFIYVALDNTDANPVFFVSRLPNYKTFLDASIFNEGSGNADFHQSGLTLTNVTTANYDSSSCLLLGTIECSLDGTDDWTVESIYTPSSDIGMGLFAEKPRNFPRGVIGARAGSYFKDNGGTAPTMDLTDQFSYLIEKAGRFHWDLSFRLGGTPLGDVEAQLIRPLVGFVGTTLTCVGTLGEEIEGLQVNRDLVAIEANSNNFVLSKVDGTPSVIMNSELEARDVLRCQISYNL